MKKTGQSLSIIYHIVKGPVFLELKIAIVTTTIFEPELVSSQVFNMRKTGLWGRKLTSTQIKFIKLWSRIMDSRQEGDFG
jgi:hypothetical protein